MRIVHNCLRYPPATGGVETYVQELVERTRSLDANRDVRVLTSKLRTHHPISELTPELLIADPMYVQRLHHLRTPFFAYPRLQALPYYLNHHEPDIIHGHSFWYQPADTAARFAQKHNIPFIFHPYYYQHGVRQKAGWQLYKRTIGKNTFAAANIVVVISPYEQLLIEKAGFPVKRFELIPPGIDLLSFQTSHDNPFAKRNITGPTLLSVGRIAHDKGFDDVVALLPVLIKQFPALQYAIVGEDFGAKEKLISEAQKLGVKERVHFLGKLPQSELIGAYQHAIALVHPSYYEAFGIVMAESLAAGNPIVARNIAAIPFVVPHQKAGLLFNNKQELLYSLTSILSDRDLRKKLASQGFRHVQQNFTWDKSIKKLIALYQEFSTSNQ
ncbi:MAG: glycosyltransferase family 4 protein [bacterium]